MKKLTSNQLASTNGGYTCAPTNGNGVGQCFPSLCLFVGAILASNPSATSQFEVCPL